MAKGYVSSTYVDLQEAREKVRLVLRRLGHEDVAMEYSASEDNRPINVRLADLDACDFYLGIFAWRYGFIPSEHNPEGLSVTEIEYRHAVKTGKPRFIFLLSDEAPWPAKCIDSDRSRIERLREELTAQDAVHFFMSADELGVAVVEAIHAWEKEQGRAETHPPGRGLDLAAYYRALTKRYQRLDLDALTPPQKEEYLQLQLRSIFVEQSVRESPPPVELPKELWERLERDRDVHPEDLPADVGLDALLSRREAFYEKPVRPVLDVLTEQRGQRTIILGDPGSGKSTLARYVLLSLINDSSEGKLQRAFRGYVPLLVELRSYSGLRAESKCDTFLEFLEYLGKTEGWQLGQGALHDYLKTDGRAVVIFDGLDEIFDPEERERVARRVAGFAYDYPKARVIVMSRVIGYRRKILSEAGFDHFTLQDLDEQQVAAFVDKWYGLALSDQPEEARVRRERIMHSFGQSASIRQLAGNPMLLTIMAIIGKHQELPKERWKLYDHAASVLLQHWDVNKHLLDRHNISSFIGEEDKKELLRRLALRMQTGGGGLAGNYIHNDQLQAEFETYLTERHNQPPPVAASTARAMIDQFRERNFILSLYGANLYGFVHRAFLEYFCASAYVHQFEKTRELTLEQLKQEVYAPHWEDRSWHEVLRLICGMISEKFAGEIIDYLAGGLPKLPIEYSHERPPWNIALAIQCLSEVRSPNAVAEAAMRLLKAVCTLFEQAMGRAMLSGFLEDPIVPAVEIIGKDWPYKGVLVEWLRELDSFNYASGYAEQFGRFVGSVGKGHEEIHRAILSYQSHVNKNYRVLAPIALAVGWKDDPKTFSLICDLAVNDTNDSTRRMAIRALGEHFRDDPQSLALLRDRVVNDKNSNTRSAALYVLAEYFGGEPQTLQLLRECALSNDYIRVHALWALGKYFPAYQYTAQLLREQAVSDDVWVARAYALGVLGEHFSTDPQTLLLLRDRALNDESEYVRDAAIEGLGEHFRDDPQTLPFLRERAANDEGSNVRTRAVRALVEHFRDDPHVLPLLRDRAVQDEYWFVNSIAIRALAEHFRDSPQTLSLLQDRAVNGSSQYVRLTAIQVMAERFHDNPQTLALLSDSAAKDEDAYVRSGAIRVLGQHFQNEVRVLLLLGDLAASDGNVNVRGAAVGALADYFREDPKTLPLLLKLAQDGSAENVSLRAAAVGGLARGWPDDPQTLPILDRAAGEDEPEEVRKAAAPRLQIRKRRVSAWVDWLNGEGDEAKFLKLPQAAEGFPVVKVRAVRLRNIRAFVDTGEVSFAQAESRVTRPMTLLLGDNAAGKSTILRSISLAALGPEMANQAEKRPEGYLRHGADRGWIEVSFHLQLDPVGERPALGTFCVGLEIRAGENSFRAMEDRDLTVGYRNAAAALNWLRRRTDDKFGFLCGYGALRGLADNPSTLLPEEPKEALERVVSLFRANAPLMDPDVLSKMLAGDLSNFRTAPVKQLAEDVRVDMARNLQRLLPGAGDYNSPQSACLMMHGVPVSLRDLSDGYGSLLALVGHLFRHGLAIGNWKTDPAQVFGVALVDEIDLHLHPEWQRRVVPDLRQVFPNLQFIGTSHSAMVAGSVPTDSIVVLRRAGSDIQIITELPSVEGWRADQILTSLLFDLPTSRDVQTEELFSRYARLLNERGPEDPEVSELGKSVSRAMDLEGEGTVDAHTYQLLDDVLAHRFQRLDEKTRNLVLAKAGLMLSNGESTS